MEHLSSPDLDQHRHHYADVMGRVACLEAMKSLGRRRDELYLYSSPYDVSVLDFGKLIALGKHETFLDQARRAQHDISANINSMQYTALRDTQLLDREYQLEQSNDIERLEQAVTLVRTREGWDSISSTMLTIAHNQVVPHYIKQLRNNIDQSISDPTYSGSYLNLRGQLFDLVRNAEFYTDSYYQEENLKKW